MLNHLILFVIVIILFMLILWKNGVYYNDFDIDDSNYEDEED